MTTKEHRPQKQRPASIRLALVALTLLITATATSQAALIAGEYNGVRIIAPGSTVEGKTIGEWGGDWWSWALGQTSPGDPLSDTTGANAGVGQSGPVFFVAGTTGGTATRTFTVPKDKYLLFPLVNILFYTNGGDPEDTLDTDAAAIADQVDSWTFIIDGIDVSSPGAGMTGLDLSLFREATPSIFDINVVDSNVFSADPGPGRAFSDGYYVMVEPLGKGATHEFTFGGGVSNFDFTTEVTSTISVPTPGILPLFSAAALALFGVQPRNRSRI